MTDAAPTSDRELALTRLIEDGFPRRPRKCTDQLAALAAML